jgi:hypothetical protein
MLGTMMKKGGRALQMGRTIVKREDSHWARKIRGVYIWDITDT